MSFTKRGIGRKIRKKDDSVIMKNIDQLRMFVVRVRNEHERVKYRIK